jgi:hypothetical protein
MDLELGRSFLLAFGVQELYSRWQNTQSLDIFMEVPVSRLPPEYLLPLIAAGRLPIAGIPHAAVIRPSDFSGDVSNHGLTSSAYSLVEYTSPNQRFGAELGLRADHFYLVGRDFDIQTVPALNPRTNLDFIILKNSGPIDALTATVGTGLFSSLNLANSLQSDSGIDDFEFKMNRSWTSVVGTKVDLEQGYSFNIEGYYKRVFDRAYSMTDATASTTITPTYAFDGVGNVWGFDLQLQKMESRYWDGWISYSFNWAKYHDPGRNVTSDSDSENIWYYPSFHRFHNFNLVLNIKPVKHFNIAARFGFASGRLKSKVGETISPYPVQEIGADGLPVMENGKPVIIQKYRRDSWYDENERTTWSLPLDLKLSFFSFDRKNRVQTETYLGAENLLSLVYKAEANTSFNSYTGRMDTGGDSAVYELPIPMVSFGFKWSY